MSMFGISLLRRFAVSALQRPPIIVRPTAGAGRGVFATRDIAQGEFIHSAEPIVAHPKLDYISKVCYLCLRPRDQQLMHPIRKHFEDHPQANVHASTSLEAEGQALSRLGSYRGAPLFCSSSCAASAENFFMIESRGDWSELHDYCRKNSLKFPLVAGRLACMVIVGSASPHALDILAYPSVPHGTTLQWREERALLARTLKQAGVQPSVLEFLSEDWYGGVIARLHINAFAVEMIDTGSYGDLFDAAASSISGEGSLGTAVYTLPSMYNHDCDPNVHVQWPENSSIRLDARQAIKAGEELRITYVDASLGYHARQEILSNAYGFLCLCSRCRDRD